MELEARRLEHQAALDGQRTRSERNRLGQFATPAGLAEEIVSSTLRLVSNSSKLRFLDPGFGTGAFYSALLRQVQVDRVGVAEGFEIDPHYGSPARELWSVTPLTLHLEDFTRATPSHGLFNVVVCNPPYVRHHHLAATEKKRLQAKAKAVAGVRLSGLAGLYCYFLTLTHAWMAEGAVAAWLIPSEFMDVNYGAALKQYLLDRVTLLRIHRFSPDDVQFDDALVSSAVVWFRNDPPGRDLEVVLSFGGTLDSPAVCKTVSVQVLRSELKWTRLSVEHPRGEAARVTLGDLFHIKRGLATGDNSFFILPPDRAVELGLPPRFLRPILPSPRYLRVTEVQADEKGLPLIEKASVLLDCRLSETDVERRFPRLWSYLESGKPTVASRYLCRHRSPWYSQEERPPAPILCTYLARSRRDARLPFRFILNHSQATAPNVYLLLYPKSWLRTRLPSEPDVLRGFGRL